MMVSIHHCKETTKESNALLLVKHCAEFHLMIHLLNKQYALGIDNVYEDKFFCDYLLYILSKLSNSNKYINVLSYNICDTEFTKSLLPASVLVDISLHITPNAQHCQIIYSCVVREKEGDMGNIFYNYSFLIYNTTTVIIIARFRMILCHHSIFLQVCYLVWAAVVHSSLLLSQFRCSLE